MSIFGALFSGVSGLGAQAQAMGMLADNITNVNTTGYKETSARFSSLVTASAVISKHSPGGVQSTPQQFIDRQGLTTFAARFWPTWCSHRNLNETPRRKRC